MTWSYRIAKETIKGKVKYSLVEAYQNEEGGIWGYTNHTDTFGYIQHEEFDDDDDLIDSLTTTLAHLISDIDKPIIDIDNFEPDDTGFGDIDDIEVVMSDN